MRRGNDLEPVARRAYEQLRRVTVEESGLHPHPLYPKELAASPDGIVVQPGGKLSDVLVEFKAPRLNSKGPGLTDAYLIQIQLTMACTQTRFCDFAVLRESRDNYGTQSLRQLAITRVDRDDSLLSVVEAQLLAFHAEARKDDEPFPPNPIDTAQLRMAIREAREEHVGEERVYDL